MAISEVTRRDIIDEIQGSTFAWHGRLSEVDFLSRLYRLSEMPSYDVRFPIMEAEIIQHRLHNSDWPDNWVFTDKRINLLACTDDKFLMFICEMLHPVVRTKSEEVVKLLKIFNQHLEGDGYEIFESRMISGRPVYAARLLTEIIQIATEKRISSSFVREQIIKCDDKLKTGDYDGAITNARSLVEGILGEVYLQCTGQQLEETGNLLSDYKKVKGLLNLSEDEHAHEGMKGLVRGFNGIIQNLDSLSNRLGDRHRRSLKPAKHQAKLVVDSAKTISDFLYSSLEFQVDQKTHLARDLLTALNSNKRFLSRKELLEDTIISGLLADSDMYLRRLIKDEIIANYNVDSYRQSDIFFAAMRILMDVLTQKDIENMYIESQTNDQMIGWGDFSEELEKERPGLFGAALANLYDNFPPET
ncbi:MAG: abortive infection family protein [Candidatus Paceibacterota bacterium]|nr:MAG: abortive infection family protein [Candidatus Paceibacterota bacterium]